MLVTPFNTVRGRGAPRLGEWGIDDVRVKGGGEDILDGRGWGEEGR